MKRRAVCASLAGIAVWPGPGRAQPAQRHARIAVLGGSVGMADPATLRDMVEPLRKGLRELGWVEGRNLDIEWRFAEGQPQRLPALLAESMAVGKPDVLVAIGPRPAMLAKDATRTLPIVAVPVDDPVQMGLADSYARPGAQHHRPVRRLPRHPVAAAAVAEGPGAAGAPRRHPDEPLYAAARHARPGRGRNSGARSTWRSWCSRRAGPRTSTPRWRRWRATGSTAC